MDDAIKRFQQRRSARLGFDTIKHYDSVKEYRKRRAERLAARMDAEGDEESTPAQKKGGGGHGNTKLPFGLCQREGIEVKPGWTPQDAWKALEGKGYSAGEAYKELKETGKVSKKGNSASAETGTKTGSGKKDYSSMGFDDLKSEFEQHLERYKNQEQENKENKERIPKVGSAINSLRMLTRKGVYNGETYEQVKKAVSEGKNWPYLAMKNVMEELGEDAFTRDPDEVVKEGKAKMEEYETGKSFYDLNQEREALIDALATQSKKKYPNISDCDSKIALESRMRADDYYDVGYAGRFRLDYSLLDEKAVKDIAQGLDGIKTMFPELSGMLKPPMMEDLKETRAYAECAYGRGDPEVRMSKSRFSNVDDMQSSLDSDVRSGFHPKGTNSIKAVITHEYGHAIDDIMTHKYSKELGGKSMNEYILGRLMENHPHETRETIMRKVSRYSLNNDSPAGVEFMAEAFSEFCCSKKPRPIAMEVGQIMTEFVKNPKSALKPKKPKWQWAPPDDDDEEVPLF